MQLTNIRRKLFVKIGIGPKNPINSALQRVTCAVCASRFHRLWWDGDTVKAEHRGVRACGTCLEWHKWQGCMTTAFCVFVQDLCVCSDKCLCRVWWRHTCFNRISQSFPLCFCHMRCTFCSTDASGVRAPTCKWPRYRIDHTHSWNITLLVNIVNCDVIVSRRSITQNCSLNLDWDRDDSSERLSVYVFTAGWWSW